ncbi:hypothetical protein ACP6J5_09020 [Staphylococcus simulans]|uniref:hypothetical protein n=1 Tax=Staphylococcus simulans TaxID=1286 RepID=UPI003F7DC943
MQFGNGLINREMRSDDIVQIIPAPQNLYTRFYDELDGYVYMPIVCMALTNKGEVKFCDADGFGDIEIIDLHGNNEIYKYNEKTKEYEVL